LLAVGTPSSSSICPGAIDAVALLLSSGPPDATNLVLPAVTHSQNPINRSSSWQLLSRISDQSVSGPIHSSTWLPILVVHALRNLAGVLSWPTTLIGQVGFDFFLEYVKNLRIIVLRRRV
jgi:hypothetical protein